MSKLLVSTTAELQNKFFNMLATNLECSGISLKMENSGNSVLSQGKISTHHHPQPFYGLFSRTIWVSWCQK